MTRKNRSNLQKESVSSKSRQPDGLSEFLNSSKAKWVFFAVYLLMTLFMFRSFIFSDDMLFGRDTIPDGVYTRKYYQEYHEEFGGIPRWNPYVLGGLPFIDAMHGDTFYPLAWLKFMMPLHRALGHKLMWHVLLAGMLMYVFLRTLCFRRDVSFLGGLMYMLAPSFVTLVYPAHDAKMYIIAWLPLAFTFLERGMRRPKLLTFALLGAVMGLLILTSHVQMAYYSYWALGLYFLFRLFTGDDRTTAGMGLRTGFFILAVTIAVTMGAVQLFPAYKFTTVQSVRSGEHRTSYEYATSWSLHPEEVAGMVVPSFQGNTFLDYRRDGMYANNLYWGRNAFKLNSEYHGALLLVLALLALVFARNRLSIYLGGLSVLSLVYALGANTPFYHLFYALVPGVKNFRAPSMIVFLFCFAITVLAVQFLASFLDGSSKLREGDRRILYFIGGILGAAVIVTAMGKGFFGLWNNILGNEMTMARSREMIANIPVFIADMWRVAILISAALGGIWMYLSRKIGAGALILLLALVTVVDQSVVNNRFLIAVDPGSYRETAPDSSVRELQKRLSEDGEYRALGMLARYHPSNYYAMFGIQMADGSHNNELQTYELFRGPQSVNYLLHWLDEAGNFTPDGMAENNYLKAAGVRYILIPGESGVRVIENESALPKVHVVHDFIPADNDTMAVRMLADPELDSAKTVVLEVPETVSFDVDNTIVSSSAGSVRHTKDGIEVSVKMDGKGFVVLSENYVPYWSATIEGEPAEIYRANGTFMAVKCDGGTHDVRFTFRSGPYETGKRLTYLSVLFTLGTIALSLGMDRMRRKKG